LGRVKGKSSKVRIPVKIRAQNGAHNWLGILYLGLGKKKGGA